jgi:hypothetical protein
MNQVQIRKIPEKSSINTQQIAGAWVRKIFNEINY